MSFTILNRKYLIGYKVEKPLAIAFNNNVLKGIISCVKSARMIFIIF